jgi:signal peptidase I
MKNFFSFIFELLKVVAISIVIIIPIRYFLIQPFYVKGASMEPTFHDHEYLIIDEISYRFGEPKRGDVIVFRYPRDPREYYIKRVIGLPGEKIQVKGGNIFIYNDNNPEGFNLEEKYLPNNLETYGTTEEIINVGQGEYYVFGDNRPTSKDSRNFGPVKRSFLIGKVLLRGWPFDRAGVFGEVQYQN